MVYLYIGAIVVSEAVAYYMLKNYSMHRHPSLFVAGVLCYAAVCYFLVRSFAYKDIGIVNIIWSVVSILAILGVGTVFFHESINWKEGLGIGFALIGIVLLGGR